MRGLVKPPPEYAIAYIDWSQQEYGIAAALSGDQLMMEAYRSGDSYLSFGKQCRAIPADATKQTHGAQRELFKQCVLGVQYGMEARSLALRLNQPTALAHDLLRAHRETYRTFWRWCDAAVDYAMLHGSISTVFGWNRRITAGINPRSLRNHPMQANGAEMLRLACCFATGRRVEIAAPIHDAVLICAPLNRINHDVEVTRAAMAAASKAVLAGFELRSDVRIIRYPDRYSDPRGAVMWERVTQLIAQREGVGRLAA